MFSSRRRQGAPATSAIRQRREGADRRLLAGHQPLIASRCLLGRKKFVKGRFAVESGCGAVALGLAYRLPSLSMDGALLSEP